MANPAKVFEFDGKPTSMGELVERFKGSYSRHWLHGAIAAGCTTFDSLVARSAARRAGRQAGGLRGAKTTTKSMTPFGRNAKEKSP